MDSFAFTLFAPGKEIEYLYGPPAYPDLGSEISDDEK